MTEPERSGSCVVCQLRDPRYPQACDACRSRLAGWLSEIPHLVSEMDAPIVVERDVRLKWVRVDGQRVTTRWPADPVGNHLRADPVPGARNGGKVSGSKEPPIPLPVTAFDLRAPHRFPNITRLYEEQLDDQVGELSVATILDLWVRDWRDTRDKAEHLPPPLVADLCSWLGNRLEWACDDHPAVDEFAQEIGRLRSLIRMVLGLRELPDYKTGVPCRRCDSLTLFRDNGSDWIECGNCPDLMSPEEYGRWTGLLAAEAKDRKRTAEGATA